MDTSKYKGIFATSGKGFHLTFDNGWTVSVQWGPGNYSDNYHQPYGSHIRQLETSKPYSSKTAEIAAWDKAGKRYDFGSDKIKGYVSTDEVAAFIVMVADFVVKKAVKKKAAKRKKK